MVEALSLECWDARVRLDSGPRVTRI